MIEGSAGPKNLDVPGPGAWAMVWASSLADLPALRNWQWSTHGPVRIGRHLARVPDGPYVHEVGEFSIVARGLLTNASELEGANDGERVLNAYRRWGRDCVSHLHGTFAFAIWDGSQLFAARDRLGLEPAYRYLGGQTSEGDITIVTNEVDAIFAIPGLALTPDPEYVVLQVARRHYEAPTMHREIRRLMPAHRASAKRPGTLETSRWWEPTISKRQTTPEQDAEEMRALLFDSIEGIHRAADAANPDSTHGSELSGGLDSSAVVGVVGPILDEQGLRLPVFSQVLPIGSDHPSGDEREYIEAVLDMVDNADPHWVFPFDPADEHFDRVESRTNLGGIGGGKEKLIAVAAAESVTDLWSGFGGDEYATFNGRNYHGHLLLNGKLVRLVKEAKGRSQVRKANPLGVMKGSLVQAKNILEDQRWWPLDVATSADDLYLTPALNRLVDVPDVAAYAPLSIRETLRDVQRLLIDIHPGASRAERENGTALRYGMMFRFPLEDPRFVDLSMSLEPDRHMRDGWHRWIWRQSTHGVMPELVRWRNDKRPPMPGGGMADERNKAIAERDIDHAEHLHPLALEWIDVDRAEREMKAAAASPTKDGQAVLTPRRAISTAYALTAEAKRCGW